MGMPSYLQIIGMRGWLGILKSSANKGQFGQFDETRSDCAYDTLTILSQRLGKGVIGDM